MTPNISLEEAHKIANAIKAGKNYYFEDYQQQGEGIRFFDNSFWVENYYFEASPFKKVVTSSVKHTEEEIILYLQKRNKRYFADYL